MSLALVTVGAVIIAVAAFYAFKSYQEFVVEGGELVEITRSLLTAAARIGFLGVAAYSGGILLANGMRGLRGDEK